MKRMYYCLIALVFLSFNASVSIAGGIQPDSFTLSGVVGGYSFDGEQHLETRPAKATPRHTTMAATSCCTSYLITTWFPTWRLVMEASR